MAQNPETSTNPGLVNVADQGDGLTTVDQPVTVSPSSNSGAATAAQATGGGSSAVATATNPGDANVVSQAFGRGLPKNVNIA